MSEQTVILIAAIFSSIVGIGSFFHYVLHVQSWPRTRGQVVGNHAGRRSEGEQYCYFPIVEFYASDGRKYRFKGDLGRTREWPVGQSLRLRYRPANPAHASIANAWQRLIFSLAFTAFALAFWAAWLGVIG